MPQMLIQVSGMKHKTDGDRLVLKGETVAGVKMVNANHDDGRVPVKQLTASTEEAVFLFQVAFLM